MCTYVVSRYVVCSSGSYIANISDILISNIINIKKYSGVYIAYVIMALYTCKIHIMLALQLWCNQCLSIAAHIVLMNCTSGDNYI